LAFHFHNADHSFRCPNRRKIKAWLLDFASVHQRTIGEISIVFCSDRYLLEINKTHLQHDYYTDIITFDYCEGDTLSADILISVDRVKENAISHKQLFFNELLRVIAHGNLHLIGYKDKTKKDSIAMREAEEQWILRYYELHP
jgi:probable rRNA maturation factor